MRAVVVTKDAGNTLSAPLIQSTNSMSSGSSSPVQHCFQDKVDQSLVQGIRCRYNGKPEFDATGLPIHSAVFQRVEDANRVISSTMMTPVYGYNTSAIPRYESEDIDAAEERYLWKFAKTLSAKGLIVEMVVRLAMILGVGTLQFTPAFHRLVQVQDMHKYSYPMTDSLSYVLMTLIAISAGYLAFIPSYRIYKQRYLNWCTISPDPAQPDSTADETLPREESKGRVPLKGKPWTRMRQMDVAKGCFTRSLFWNELIAYTLALSMAAVSNMLFTNFIKSLYGELRPDYFSRCFPSLYSASMSELKMPYTPSTMIFECEATNSFTQAQILLEGRKSFPSGHSSMVCGLGTVIVWHIMERCMPSTPSSLYTHESSDFRSGRSAPGLKLFGYLLGSIPVLYVLIGRTRDYRHHWYDVIAGAVIGICFGLLSVSLYFHVRLSRAQILHLTGQKMDCHQRKLSHSHSHPGMMTGY